MYCESNVIELKEQLVDDVKKEIVAFLNTDGGTIYVGVKDDGTVVPFISKKRKRLFRLQDCKLDFRCFLPNSFKFNKALF